jgi:hypothetical protein
MKESKTEKICDLVSLPASVNRKICDLVSLPASVNRKICDLVSLPASLNRKILSISLQTSIRSEILVQRVLTRTGNSFDFYDLNMSFGPSTTVGSCLPAVL